MRGETTQSIRPDDRENYTRREALAKGLRLAKRAGILVAAGSAAHILYKDVKVGVEVAGTHPKPSQKDYALATKTLEEHSKFGDQSQKRVDWAQQQVAKKEEYDQELNRREDNLHHSWWKVGKYPLIGGAATAVGSGVAETIVKKVTKREFFSRPYQGPSTR